MSLPLYESDPAKFGRIVQHLITGRGIRWIAETEGTGKSTVRKILAKIKHVAAKEGKKLRCPCGRPHGHGGTCRSRIGRSLATRRKQRQ